MKKKRSKVIVTTSRNRRVECLPIFTMIEGLEEEERDKLMLELDVPLPVTYTFTDVAGEEVTKGHDDTSIADPKTPDEDRETWERRKRLLALIDVAAPARAGERSMRIIATRGIRILDMPPEEEWIAEHKWLGYDIPDDARERLCHYFSKEIVGTQEDGFELMAGIARASGLDEEVLKRVEAGFQSEVGRPEGSDAGGDSEAPVEAQPE